MIRFDPRDTGLSGEGGDIYRFTEMAHDVKAVSDAAEVDRTRIVAVSMGGMMAIDFAVRYPRGPRHSCSSLR